MNIRRFIVSTTCTVLALGVLTSPAIAATKATDQKKVTKKTVSRVPRRSDGVLVAPKNANNRILAVMIENHTAARPQAGLDQASVVYEALAEGGIPRFMAMFSHYGDVGLIGPVRSARPYYLRFAAEYGAALVHAGGSPDAQDLLKRLRLRNIEALKDPTARYFFRLGYGVHSLFTNGQLLSQANAQYKKVTPRYRPWKYVSDPPKAKRRTGKHGATVDLGPGLRYMVGYEYSRSRNAYLRSTGGRPHVDKVSRRQLAAKNVILQFVPKERVLDRKGRIELKVTGSGKAVLMQNGFSQTIKWSKPKTSSRTIFRYLNGSEIKLVRGSTWITVVPKGKKYTVY